LLSQNNQFNRIRISTMKWTVH